MPGNTLLSAAYGTEMIRSALDREAHPHELESRIKAIAFHCNIAPEDIRVLVANDGGDMSTLRHFVAIDRATNSVVLALRGTLSVSSALIDMKAMDCKFGLLSRIIPFQFDVSLRLFIIYIYVMVCQATFAAARPTRAWPRWRTIFGQHPATKL